jgi:hypothetical protein
MPYLNWLKSGPNSGYFAASLNTWHIEPEGRGRLKGGGEEQSTGAPQRIRIQLKWYYLCHRDLFFLFQPQGKGNPAAIKVAS